MTNNNPAYKISLSGDVSIKDRPISEELARQIINLVMGGNATHTVQSGAIPLVSGIGNSAINATSSSTMSPKVFMAQKKPSSEMERMTCLAYYLSHYRDMRAFKTRDISKINTEAAQAPFTNAAVFARNATNVGYLAKAGGGAKQITVLGEAVVEALPDREKVKSAIDSNRPVKRSKRRKSKKAK